MRKRNILKFLERDDKWFLGGGNRLFFAPPFPQWLEAPGMFDQAHYYNIPIDPLFTWTLLDERGEEIPLEFKRRRWNPAAHTKRFNGTDVAVEERQSCLPEDALATKLKITNRSEKNRRFHLVAWTAQPHDARRQGEWIDDIAYENGAMNFTKNVEDERRPRFSFACAFGFHRNAKSHMVSFSQGGRKIPRYRHTPFWEQFEKGKLPDTVRATGVEPKGLLYIGVSIELRVEAGKTGEASVYFAAAPKYYEAQTQFDQARRGDPTKKSEANWNKYFQSVPAFDSDDEYITRYYWYRWFGLRLFYIDGRERNYRHPAVCEGLSYFRAPISYSAMCHQRETRWASDPSVAEGSLLNFIENQREDGGFRGYIDPHFYRQEMFYHADWGETVNEVFAVHGDVEYLDKVYDGLAKYFTYFVKERDAEGDGLYDIDNHYETGQEYMHRYMAVSDQADVDHWGEVFRLKGVDVTVYIYNLARRMAEFAERLGKPAEEIERWRAAAKKIGDAILEKMWDEDEEMFFDVNPFTGLRTKVKATVCFYPYHTDLVSEKHLSGLKKHLLNPGEFWTPYPVPSSSVDDKFFSAPPEWKGQRMNCPWNGRVWPMTNSHAAEALAQSAVRFDDDELRGKTVELIDKFVKMMFYDGDVARPNCYEHYNPYDGKACEYRGVDDYQHSWVVDLVVKYIAGVRPEADRIVVDPFPFKMKRFELANVLIRDKRLSVKRSGKSYTVEIDGQTFKKKIGEALVVSL
jgi:hypothetical protein